MSTFEVIPVIINIEDTDTNFPNNNISIEGSTTNNEAICLDSNDNNDKVDFMTVNSIIDNKASKVVYGNILELATDLCRTVSDNHNLFDWISKLRQDDDFGVTFHKHRFTKGMYNSKSKKTIDSR